MDSLDDSKGPGPDRIPPLLIKNCARSLSLPVTILFNRSLGSCLFPQSWKSASITPIHKAGNLHHVENYRGISILSCLPKILESLVYDRLYSSVSHIISQHQHGFVKNRSATTNLMKYVSTVMTKMDKRQQVDAVYVDFSKAFDKVPHKLVVEKLNRLGIPTRMVQWLQSYLEGRTAYVRLGDSRSQSFEITSGVPQGSHLGPLLFVLFINDLCLAIRSSKLLYADDLKIFRTICSLVDCCALQDDIGVLIEWCTVNGMSVNISKCNVITFSRQLQPIVFDYKMSVDKICRTTTIKDLGLLLDSKLKFSQHISSTIAKAFAVLGFIRRNTQHFHDYYCLKALYCALVRSILEYGVVVWAPFHAEHISRIERVQRSFLRYALRHLPWTHLPVLPPYEQRCRLIHLPTLHARRKYLQRMFVFDLLQNNIDCPELLEMLRINTPTRIMRRTSFFRLETRRTQHAQNMPFDTCCARFEEVFNVFDFDLTKQSFKSRIINLN